jgi:hypothetical protein
VAPHTILIHELASITVRSASRTGAAPFSRLHGGPAQQALVPDPKIKSGTDERNHRLGLLNLLSRDGESRGQAAGSRVTL